jgi:hypothetical protein
VVLQDYQQKKQALDEHFEPFKAAYMECDSIARELGLKREHYEQLKVLLDTKNMVREAFLQGAYDGGTNAEINLASRIRDGKAPFTNWEAAKISAQAPK